MNRDTDAVGALRRVAHILPSAACGVRGPRAGERAGLGGVSALGTIAALNILGRVSRLAAAYDTRVRVMNNDPIVLAVSQEVVKHAYTEAGRPDAYNPDDVSLVAYDQFS